MEFTGIEFSFYSESEKFFEYIELKGKLQYFFFPFIEKMIDRVKETINNFRVDDCEMTVCINNKKFTVFLDKCEDMNVYRNILIDSFYVLTDDVLDELGVLGKYEYPKSFVEKLKLVM